MAEAVETKEMEMAETKKGGSNILLIIVVVMLFLILAGGAAAAYFILNEDTEILDDAQHAKQTQVVKAVGATTATASARSTDYSQIGPMYPMDQFIVNLYNEGSSRYLKTTINFELSLAELSTEMDTKKPLIRDIVIKTLSAKTYEEISTIRGKESLKDEIAMKVNQVLSDGQVNNLFFTDFVIQ